MKVNAVVFLDEDGGQGLVEYSLILSLVVVGLIGVLGFLGENVFALYLDSVSKILP